MCLATITDRKPRMKEGIGYKVFRQKRNGSNEIVPLYMNDETIPLDQWITDESTGRIMMGHMSHWYNKGFHIYEHKKNADTLVTFSRVVLKVRYRDTKYLGTNWAHESQIVARQMYVESAQ